MLKSCKSAIIRKLSWRIGWRKHLHSLSIEDLSKSKVFPNLLWIPGRIYDGHLGLNEKEYTEKEERDNCFCCVNAIKSSKMQHFEVGVLLFPSLVLSWYRGIVGSVKCGLHCRKCIYLSFQIRFKRAVWIVSVTPRKKIISFGNLKSTKYLLSEERIVARQKCLCNIFPHTRIMAANF